MSSNRPPVDAQAQLELQHIQLELQHGRADHFRHFIDQFYCFTNDFVNRNGGAKWSVLHWHGFVSKSARVAAANEKKVVKDHVVPLRVIQKELVELAADGTPSLSAISDVLVRLTHFGAITEEENQNLRDAGMNHRMPAGFYDPGSPLHGDLLSRYRAVGIELEPPSKESTVGKIALRSAAGQH